MSKDKILKLMRDKIGYRNQVHVAAEIGVSPAFLCDVLRGRKEPSEKVLAHFGLERVVRVSYRRASDACTTAGNANE